MDRPLVSFETIDPILPEISHIPNKESLKVWINLYFKFEDTTAESSRKIKKSDYKIFLEYLDRTTGGDLVSNWTPRLSRMFIDSCQHELNVESERRWSDRTINRFISHLKTVSKWIDRHYPFRLGDPMKKIKLIKTSSLLDIERAFTKDERSRILKAADNLLKDGRICKDSNPYRKRNGKRRKNFRPLRNRAIVYLMIETGMRRAAVTTINRKGFDPFNGVVNVVEKGGYQCKYYVSDLGIKAVLDYFKSEEHERDAAHWNSNALFLKSSSCKGEEGRLGPGSVDNIWNMICKEAGVKGRSPHSARHAMGKHVYEKTKDLGEVQIQLNHINPIFSMQYNRTSPKVHRSVLNDR